MSSIISTESRSDTSGNVGTGGTLKELKTDFANLLINRVTLGECLNVIRDACVARASTLVDEADEPTLESIKKDVAAFQEVSPADEAGSCVGDGSAPTGPVPDATGPVVDATGPVEVGHVLATGDGSSPDAGGPTGP